jgi:ATP-GRASP peptide maturase of grasp-with-spasm system
MILVFSKYDDPSTNEVCDWLRYFGQEIVRINNSEDLSLFFNAHLNIQLTNSYLSFANPNVKSVWFRRPPAPLHYKVGTAKAFVAETNHFFSSEFNAVFDVFYSIFKDVKWLNDLHTSRPRKFDQLLVAKDVGLAIPNTAIIGCKKELQDFCIANGKVIMKPIQDPRPISINHKMFLQYTTEVTQNLLDHLPDTFFPCLFQQLIDKNIEIRTFFLNGQCFSMAICSTFDKQTQIDFRRYNDRHPNRCLPYQLPLDIENKISLLMDKMRLNCGSLDLILDNHGTYYYLEVNPVGQFGMVSYPCNYNIEKEIAEFLIKE